MIDARTRLAGVIGSPVAHSLSPAVHNAAFADAGLNWTYVAFEVPSGEHAGALDAMRALGICGMSVTMPHKEGVFAAVDEVDDAAAALRSVNTVQLLPGGRLRGSSTDGAGFVASLAEQGVAVAGARTLVFGAGGAARAVVDALARAGAAEVVVVNRSASRGHEAAALAGAVGRLGSEADVRSADVVVNATSVGMGTDVLPFDPAPLREGQVVADLVYHPLHTALLRAAAAAGARPVDGLGMLVHQAALQQLQWTGVAPDPAVMRRAALAELDRRAAAAGR